MAKQKRKPGRRGRSGGAQGSPAAKGHSRPAPRRGTAAPGGGRSAPGPAANQRAVSPGFRGRVERISWPYLRKLHELPRWLIVGASLVLLLTGLLAPRPVAVPALALIVVFLGWLTYLAWPEGDGRRKTIRLVALGLAVVAVAVRAVTT